MKYTDRKIAILSKQFPTIAACTTEIINLRAILSLPKGTEHFITDIHGEYDQFCHVIRNGSGAIRRKIDSEFKDTITEAEKKELAALIYYPKMKLDKVISSGTDMTSWYTHMIKRLTIMCKTTSSKYTRSKARKAMNPDFAYIIEELMSNRRDEDVQEEYKRHIIQSVIETERAGDLIVAMCDLIRRLVVDHLHVVGDIFDRGPYPHLIMDDLMHHHSVDIQWGNHDINWMGAACGSIPCMANVIRITAKYGNLSVLEDGYGINLVPLASFALSTYGNDPCECFKISYAPGDIDNSYESLNQKIHKAMAVIQFKVEGQLIKDNPWLEMEDRLFLDKMDLEKGEVLIDGIAYPLLDTHFPTIDPADPYRLTPEEQEVVEKVSASFMNSARLRAHVEFLYSKGSLYKLYNGNLLYHGCMPLDDNGLFLPVKVFDKKYRGKELYDVLETYARKAYFATDENEKKKGLLIMFYIWEHRNSPVFGKNKMATFERYFVADKATHKEEKNPYYRLLDNELVINNILREFDLNQDTGHIVNGHVPVEAKSGENPVKCHGKLLVIDGGFSRAYQRTTGIAGYTLVYNSYGMVIAAHEPFTSVEDVVEKGSDIHSDTILVEHVEKRMTVADTDIGKSLLLDVEDLTELLMAYRGGLLKQK